jgi:DNA recombination protein RmuC
MMDTITLLSGCILAVAAAGLGYWLGLRNRRALEKTARDEGRAEGSIELATLRERVASLEVRRGELAEELNSTNAEIEQALETIAELREQNARAKAQNIASEEKLAGLSQSLAEAERTITGLRALTGTVAQLQATLESERTAAQDKLTFLSTARDDLINQFKTLSTDILEEKSQRFAQQNVTALGELLAPVRERLMSFQSKVEEVARADGLERAALGVQLKQLLTLNQTLSQDAQNLTRALKGDQKTQGTWGEIVLETVLETAGLVEGTHFDTQKAHITEEDQRSIPDVVLRLPGDRNLVVDSKVSLTAHERCMSCETPEEREMHLKQHVLSVRAHIKGLSEKKYQKLYDLKSLDFVLLFIPLEPAFAAAISNDNHLFRDAWDRNVILVSPSTLLFVVRTVAYLWRQESQTRNVLEIVKRGAELYDKLCGFVEDLQEVGERLQQAQKAYDAGLKKFSSGKGNLIWQAQELKGLGVKPTKALPTKMVEMATESFADSEVAPVAAITADQNA